MMPRTLAIALLMLGSPLTAFAATAFAAASFDDAEKAWRTRQFSRAVTIYKGLASRGDIEAHYRLGNAYSNGKGIRKDLGAASRHYLDAAKQGHGPAAFNLALALERGHGVKINMRGALYWYRSAANADHRLAVCKLLALGFETRGAHCPAAYADAAERHRSLRRAVEKGDAKRIRTLLSKGADPNLLTAAGKPVLYRAVERNLASSVRILLEHGADPDATTTQGATPLYAAIRAHHTTVTKLLLAHDAKVDVIVRGGTTPLGLAASRGDIAATRLLLDAGADTELRGADGRRASDHALSRGHTRIAQLLRATRRQQLRAVDLELPLLSVAAARGSISVVREQISLGTDINGRDPEGMTPLMRAAEAGQDDVVKLLLELRARVTTTGPKGITALQLAAKRGHLQSVRLISRARPTPKDMDAAMNLAVSTRHWKVVDHLLAVRPRNTAPKITLTRAVADQAPHRLIENLISRGVDINGVDDQGATPLGTALKEGNAELTALLLRNGANPKHMSTGIPPICIAAVEGSPRTIELLLVSGADVNQPTEAALTTNISAGVRGDAVGGFRYDISASSTQSPGSEGDVWTHAMMFQLTAANVFGPAGSAGTTFTVGERDDEQRAAFQLYASHNFGNWYVRPRLRLDYVRDSGISKFERFTLTPLLRLDYRGRRARYELQCGASFGDSTSADRTSRELGYFVTLGYRLTL